MKCLIYTERLCFAAVANEDRHCVAISFTEALWRSDLSMGLYKLKVNLYRPPRQVRKLTVLIMQIIFTTDLKSNIIQHTYYKRPQL